MDKPADPATPFAEVYQHFLAVLRKHGRKESTLAKYLYDFKRFERWLRASGLPLTLASLIDTDLLFAYRHYLEALPPAGPGIGPTAQRRDAVEQDGPFVSQEHKVPGVVADQERPYRDTPVSCSRSLLQGRGCDASPSEDGSYPQDRDACRYSDPLDCLRRGRHPTDGAGPVRAGVERLPDLRPGGLQVGPKSLHRHAVGTGSAAVAFDAPERPGEVVPGEERLPQSLGSGGVRGGRRRRRTGAALCRVA